MQRTQEICYFNASNALFFLLLSHLWGSCLFHTKPHTLPSQQNIPLWVSAQALPCWEQNQTTESLCWTPAEILTDSCLQWVDEGSHPGTSPGLGKKKENNQREKVTQNNHHMSTLNLKSTQTTLRTQFLLSKSFNQKKNVASDDCSCG